MSAPTYRTDARHGWLIFAGIIVLLVIIGARTVASWVLDYQWWTEMGQLSTWVSMLLYGVAPVIVAALIAFVVFWIAHARALKAAGTGLREHTLYARLSTIGILLLAIVFAVAVIDSWAVVRYFGGSGISEGQNAWRDPVYGEPLTFYLFALPFYQLLLRFVLGVTLIGALLYWIAARAWTIRAQMPKFGPSGAIEIGDLQLFTGLESRFLNIIVATFLAALAIRLYLARYGMLMNDHGFMVGMDWVDENIALPLLWLTIVACIAAAVLFWIGLRRWAAVMALVLILQFAVPRIVAAAYVGPNELTIERPYIQRHIEATRSAYGLNQRTRELDFPTQQVDRIDVANHRPLLDNVRLWDWRAFHDTVTQIQPLRPYMFSDTDVDRYTIQGQLRQVLLSPRELDLSQLGDARNRWINPHFVYTHGYGMVMAESNRITANGLPVLFVKDAPPVITVPGLKLTRPELYYGEQTHEPVFVHTDQPEFNYPSGNDNVHVRYEGDGGFPVSAMNRLAAAVYYGDPNIVLTSQMASDSRMMIHRQVRDRLETLAGFVRWDTDPYLVLTDDGRLVWIVDGFLTSSAHPYSRAVQLSNGESVNYIRNSVKAVVDAYDGSARLYVFDPADPLVRAYQNLFPKLFTPEAQMPADLRAHVRYPELLFRIQAEIYRTFHMREAEAFYNKADMWDIARGVQGQEGTPQPATPTYVVATLPDESTPEFLLLIPFTPRNKDNLIGMMVARCDGPNLGELIFLQLSKQEIVLGPMQIEARINQDQVISKDLSLWNQQGSQVLRGQMIVLPIDSTFLYVEPIYIQARDARMPQLKKVVLAVGDTLIYTDTYQQALQQLAGGGAPTTPAATQEVTPPGTQTTQAPSVAPSSAPPTQAIQRIQAIRDHLRRYRELTSQGRMSEAGKELEAVEALAGK